MPVPSETEPTVLTLLPSQIEDLQFASSSMTGATRRAFQAKMTLKDCAGHARQAERVFGWGRKTVQLGLHEQRTGVTCLGAQDAFCGKRLWEEQHPDVASVLWDLARAQSQQDPTFRTALSYTRLTAGEALKQLHQRGFAEDMLPSATTMAEVLNRNGDRRRPVLKAKPQKKFLKPTRSSPTSRKKTVSR